MPDETDGKGSDPERIWYNDPLYQRYWRHYQLASAWYGYHCQLVASTSPQHRPVSNSWPTPQCGAPTGLWPGSPNHHFRDASATLHKPFCDTDSQDTDNSSTRDRRSQRKKLRRKRKTRVKTRNGDTTDEPEFEMEITPEMREFFVTSAKHKQERDAQQKEEAEDGDYIDLTEVTVHTKHITSAAPTERPGQRRTNQMKLLYGAGAAMIHGMETALQLNFDRNYDLKTPKLWPHLPLNITFHSHN